MIKIRKNVFETNSSSTHSICLCNLGKNAIKEIPSNQTINIDDDFSIDGDGYNISEWQKLCCIIDMIRYYKNGEEEDSNVSNKLFEGLKRLIKKERNSNLIIKDDVDYEYCDETDNYYGSDYGIFDMLTLDMDDEDTILKAFKDVIFDPNTVVYHKENER
jgi:hypothetical protein